MKIIASILLLCFLLAGCSSSGVAQATDTAPSTIAQTADTTPSTMVESTASETFLLYRPNESADGFVTEEVSLPSVTESSIVEELIRAGVLTDTVAINQLTVIGAQVQVDFNSAFRDLVLSQGSSGEYVLIGSVVNTILSAYDADTVSITVDGEILESGHVIYDTPLSFHE